MTTHGWSNDATWLVALALGNDEELYESVRRAKDPVDIKDMVEALLDESSNYLTTDLVNCALSQVNWSEIWNSFHEE
jgi:hypothetical protein